MKHVVNFSGGIGSWAAARRVAAKHGRENVTLLFADTLIEDTDLYRFLVEAAANIYRCAGRLDGVVQLAAATPPAKQEDMGPRREHLVRLRALVAQVIPGLVWLADGRTPWDVFRDERYLGNSRTAPCSKVLKRETCDRWVEARFTPETVVQYLGIDWTEEHRIERLRELRAPWQFEAPLCEEPFVLKPQLYDLLATQGIELPRLYKLGFSHNNCGGGCVRAGIGHFAKLHHELPEVFAEWERNEQGVRTFLDRDDIAMLKDRRGGSNVPMTLVQLRRRLDAGDQVDAFEIGGCGCFVDTEAA